MQDLKELVKPFYSIILNALNRDDAGETIERLLADNFRQMNTLETKNKTEFKTYVPGLHQLIPNLQCDIQEMLQDDNRVIVRSIVSGNPKGDFFGLQVDGSKSFNIMTIDMHTIVDSRIAIIYHLEDWTAAFRQLKG